MAPGSDSVGQPLLTRRDLASKLSTHMQTVTKWEQEGMPIAERGRRGRPSLYSEADVRLWLADREREKSQSASLSPMVRERARRDQWQANLAELEYQKRVGILIPKDDVKQAWGRHVAAVRAKLLSWSMTIADRVHRAAVLKGLAGVEHELRRATEDVLTELANGSAG